MHPEDRLAAAIDLATRRHEHQTDRAGQPYILHPLRLMARAQTETEKIVAVLHDVIEDTETTYAELAPFGDEVIAALHLLTRKGKGIESAGESETYQEFIERIAENPLAVRVKLLDLRDNLDVTRLGEITLDDIDRLEKYLRAYRRLLSVENK